MSVSKFEKLTLQEYRKLTGRTLPDLHLTYQTQDSLLPNNMLNNVHMVLGIVSELHELCVAHDDINRMEEIGDIWWYLSNYANLNNYEIVIDKFESKYVNVTQDFIYLSNILIDNCKKELAYKKVINREEIQNCINEFASFLHFITEKYTRYKTVEVFARNINKLYARYPEKFDEFLALEENRDLGNERNILEN
jgi:hypothetical protein